MCHICCTLKFIYIYLETDNRNNLLHNWIYIFICENILESLTKKIIIKKKAKQKAQALLQTKVRN